MSKAMIRDIEVYYERGGEGSPLVLLNGALDTIESDWGEHLDAFRQQFDVLAYDHRGHGRSTNPGDTFSSYAVLADDLAALLDDQQISKAHFCGFSDGGVTLLFFALRYPERVRSLVLVGAQYTNDERSLAMLEKMTPEGIERRHPEWVEYLADLHDQHRGAGYWRTLLQALRPMWQREPAFAPTDLAVISAPTLLIAGENDQFGNVDQQVAMWRALPNAELCILPHASHPVQNEQPALFQQIVLDFVKRQTS